MPQTRKPFRFWVILTSIFLLIAIFGLSSVHNSFFRPLEYITVPVLRTGHSIGQWFKNIPRPLQQKKALLKDNQRLKAENLQLLRENSALRALEEEQQTTARIETFLSSIEQHGIMAHVIGKSVSERNVLIIDAGSDKGVVEGAAVITDSGILVGTIDEVRAQTSYALLVTDTSQNIAAKIQNDSSSPGVIKGEYGLALSMELIPQNDPVEARQTVVTSALEPRIPPNILIGTITDVSKKEGSVFQSAKVISPIQLDRVEVVSVILPPNENF